MRLNMLPVIFVMLVMSSVAFSATDQELQEYYYWETAFNELGFHPTNEEIEGKAKSLHLSNAQIAEAIKSQNNEEGSKSDEIIMSSGAVNAMYLTMANKAAKSSSSETLGMGLEVKKLLDEIRREKETRDVADFIVTRSRIKVLTGQLMQRFEAEKL